jgi:glycosyltransferase involved in cell wall biosynthesis
MNDDQPIAAELAGYLSSAVGVGEAARRYARALQRAGARLRCRDVPLPGRDRVQSEQADSVPAGTQVPFEIVCLNPEQMVPYLDERGEHAECRRRIGIWSWEVDVLPKGWREASGRLDEIWTYSSFAAGLIAGGVQAPVRSVPLPVWAPANIREPTHGLPGGFRVLAMFDHLSTLQRKNPLGAIAAYKRAFAPDEGSVLVLKSVNGRHRPEQHARILAATEGRADIVLLDGTVSAAERDALLGACDCVLSLHRSEGYGLPLAEAMAIGKPVIATAYGGNMEFMDEQSSYPVSWTPALVGEGVEHYPPGAHWAEPDLDHAAQQLRSARYEPGQARQRAERGRSEVERQLSAEAVGAQMIARLRALGAPRRRGSSMIARRLRGLLDAHR